MPEALDGFKLLLESGDHRKAARFLRKSSSTGSHGRASLAAGRFTASRTRLVRAAGREHQAVSQMCHLLEASNVYELQPFP